MARTYDHNSSLVFVDELGEHHMALASRWYAPTTPTSEPAVNLLYLSKDETERDACGRQMKRVKSVVHRSKRTGAGVYWVWPDEVEG